MDARAISPRRASRATAARDRTPQASRRPSRWVSRPGVHRRSARRSERRRRTRRSGAVTNCYWNQGSPPKGSVTLYTNVDPREPKGLALKQLLDRGRKARGVPGLGDDAVFLEDADDTPTGTLFVRVGHYRVVIFRDADPQGTAASTLPTLTTLARAAIPKLR